jgi:hypothetical protein
MKFNLISSLKAIRLQFHNLPSDSQNKIYFLLKQIVFRIFDVVLSFTGNVPERVSQNKSTRLLTKASEGTIHFPE